LPLIKISLSSLYHLVVARLLLLVCSSTTSNTKNKRKLL
jgi:hypothetical protein